MRNQIGRIEASNRSTTSNVHKALVEAIKEFKENSGAGKSEEGGADKNSNDNHRYIICLTNEVGTVDSSGEGGPRIKREDVQTLLTQFGINLVVIGFGQVDDASKREFSELTKVTLDGRLIMNPSNAAIRDLFLQISNYKFQSTPLILETFN